MKLKNIPIGNSKEDIKTRERIISDFYYEWKRSNPTQRLYNIDLKDYINIRHISIIETVEHADRTYLSTLAVLQLDSILTLAKKVRIVNVKPKDKNQNQFEKMLKSTSFFIVTVCYKNKTLFLLDTVHFTLSSKKNNIINPIFNRSSVIFIYTNTGRCQ